jgi:hypothetical protein
MEGPPRVENIKKTEIINEFKTQWRAMWQNRHDDKIRAEGIAKENYELLSIDRGTVIIATRKFKPLDYYELLQKQKQLNLDQIIPPHPTVGGWRKFIKTTINPPGHTKHRSPVPDKPDKHRGQQPKKGGRGWLHFKS